MTTARSLTARRSFRPGRRSLVALLVGAGVVLTPGLAMASAPAPTAAAAAPVAAHSQAAQAIVDTAMAQRGKPYVWAGSGPGAFDCSGLTQYAAKAAGINLPHFTGSQATMGSPVAQANLQPGDLVFFYSPISHVGIYIGNGQIVHAPTSGDVVKVSTVASMGQFATARRIA
ncbi:MAG TPA: C40 family peptidase [Blastococcus sp.]|jgi:cell wall-associated NlpC family hydrolase